MNKLINWARQAYWLPPILVLLLCISQKIGNSWFYYDFLTILIFISTLSIVTLLIFYIGVKIFKNNIKSAIFSSLFLWWTFNLNLFSNYFQENTSFLDPYLANSSFIKIYSLIGYIVLSVLLFVFLKKTSRKLEKPLLIFTIMFTAMILFEGGSVFFKTNIPMQNNIPKPNSKSLTDNAHKKLPNIYFIVFDGYTSFKSLRDFWNYDNVGIKQFLTSKGFMVADNCVTPYSETEKCIGAYLNMNLIKKIQKSQVYNTYSLLNNIKRNRTTNLLSSYGYQIVNLSIFDLLNKPRYYTFFEVQDIFGNSALSIVNKVIRKYSGISNYATYENLMISQILLKGDELPCEQPFFIYAHFMLPHPAYDFNRYGLRQYSHDTISLEKMEYLEQILFANRMIRIFVNRILTKDKTKPIIVIQGDHGFRNLSDTTAKAQNTEAHSLLNAIYLSNYSKTYYDHKTLENPLNNFRGIFKTIFNLDL